MPHKGLNKNVFKVYLLLRWYLLIHWNREKKIINCCSTWIIHDFFQWIHENMKIFLWLSNPILQKFIRRSSRPEVFLIKGVLEMWSKFTGEHLCRGVISIKLLCVFDFPLTRFKFCTHTIVQKFSSHWKFWISSYFILSNGDLDPLFLFV